VPSVAKSHESSIVELPENQLHLSLAMQEMQECGQLPREIVKKLAPEIEFDDEGLPKIPNFDSIPGMAGLNNNEGCTLF